MPELTTQKCEPCRGGVAPLTAEEAASFAHELKEGWTVGERVLTRDYRFKNFKQALDFVNRVAEIAEAQGHHPDILIHGYNRVRIELSTHAIGGLSKNDFIIAAHIDGLT